MLKFLTIALWVPLAAMAQNMDYGSVSLLRGWQLPDGSYQVALRFALNPGWKTYWRAPGPAGLPPVFDWSGTQNIAAVQVDWPTPEVIEQGGMVTLGYEGELVLPIRLTPAQPGPVRVAMTLNFGVCSEICVPAQAVFLARLDGSAGEGVELIEAALARHPQTPEAAGLKQIACSVSAGGDGGGYAITATMAFDPPLAAPVTVIEYATEEIWIDLAESELSGGNITARAPLKYYGNGEMELDMSALTVSVFGRNRAVEIQGCAAAG